jgi:ABC-2 type transport system ATP-binding protein
MTYTCPPGSGADPPAVELTGVRKRFGGQTVLDGVDLAVAAGTVTALLGPNGAGKSTLVRIVATLVRPDAGRAEVLGVDVARDPAAVRHLVGLTSQDASIDELQTGEENLVVVGRLLRLGRAGARRRAAELLERFDLGAAARRPVRTYSGGMRRRLDLAASLVAAPPVVLLDEPTTGLDPRSRLALWGVVRDLVAGGTSILLTTQYLDEADQLADRVAVLSGGRVVVEGPPAALKATVGAERLVLGLARGADGARAQRTLAAIGLTATLDGAEVHLPLARPDDIRRALDQLATASVEIDRVRVSEPTLDDVFLALTAPATAGAA